MFNSETNTPLTTVIGYKKEAVLYVEIYYPPLPTPFAGEWKGLAEINTGIQTVVNLCIQSVFLNRDKTSLLSQTSVEQLESIRTGKKEALLLNVSGISNLCLCDKSQPSFTIVGQ